MTIVIFTPDENAEKMSDTLFQKKTVAGQNIIWSIHFRGFFLSRFKFWETARSYQNVLFVSSCLQSRRKYISEKKALHEEYN